MLQQRYCCLFIVASELKKQHKHFSSEIVILSSLRNIVKLFHRAIKRLCRTYFADQRESNNSNKNKRRKSDLSRYGSSTGDYVHSKVQRPPRQSVTILRSSASVHLIPYL